MLAALADAAETLVFYESPQRVLSSLEDMIDALGDREAFLFREATKIHEEYARGRLSDLRASLAGRESIKGEIVLVVSGAPETRTETASPEELFARLTAEGLTRRDAVKETARRLGLPARDVYRLVLER